MVANDAVHGVKKDGSLVSCRRFDPHDSEWFTDVVTSSIVRILCDHVIGTDRNFDDLAIVGFIDKFGRGRFRGEVSDHSI
ncbi:hypothetical protein BWO91_17010 [Plantibacter flavus]|nr:hypothetical protein BWO91_17010 [Plantibacter flavus]